MTSYNLELDDAAKFLQEHQHLTCLSPEVKQLKIHNENAQLGTRILPRGTEGDVLTERVLAFTCGQVPDKGRKKIPVGFKSDFLSSVDSYREKSSAGVHDVWVQFLGAKHMARHMGKRWVYVEEVGYFPYDASSVKPVWSELPLDKVWQDDEAALLCQRKFKEFSDAGPIWISPELDIDLVIDEAKFSKVNVLSVGPDWFTLRPEFNTGDASVSMIDILLEYRKKRREYLRAGNKWLKVPDLIKQFQWEVDEEKKTINVDRLGMIRFKAMMGEFDQLAGSRKLLDRIREQTEFTLEGQAPSLSDSKLNLRSYQHEGYQWLWWLYSNGLSGLLADEMGLGKTHQSMALMTAVSHSVKNAKFLVICPTTVLDHWLDKINDFSPSLNPRKYHGTKRSHLLSDLGKNCVTALSSYGIVMRDIEGLSNVDWDAVILDEAHFVKNIDTATYRAVCRLRSKSRFCLSGTPMENHLGELKAVYDFLLPGYLGSNEYFKNRYLAPIISGQDKESTSHLQKLIHPFKMRRTKNLVLKDLPEKSRGS